MKNDWLKFCRWFQSKNIVDWFLYIKCVLVLISTLLIYRRQVSIGLNALMDSIPLIRGRGMVAIGRRAHIHGKISVRFDDKDSPGNLKIANHFTSDGDIYLFPRGGTIAIGHDVFIGQHTIIQSYRNSLIEIGNNVMIATGCMIYGSNHVIGRKGVPMCLQMENSKGIKIGDDVWIGGGVAILDGVEIGCGAVIANGAVVTKSVEADSIVAGVPGKVIAVRH